MSKQEIKVLVPKLRFPEFRDAGEWEAVTFGGAATFINGRAYKQDELLEQGKYRVLRVGNFFTNKEWYYSDLELDENKYCDDGDLLYAWSASFAPKIWRGEKVIYHYHIWKVIEKSGIDKKFLFILLEYQTERMKAQSANGLGLLHITKGTIEGWETHFPSPKEQQKIADCLSSIDELITAHSQKHTALKAHKKGMMQQLFPVEGETIPELRFPEFRDAGEWEEKKLGDLSKILRGGSPRPIDDYITLETNGFNWLKIADVNKEAKYVTCTKERVLVTALSKTREVNPGDLIMSNSMSFGRPYILKIKSCIHDGWIAVTEIDEQANRNYLYYLILSPVSQAYFSNNAAGSGVQNLNADIIKLLPVSIPKDSEQQKIANCLSSLDDLITTQAQKIESLKTHKKGLMQQLFPATDEVNG